MRCGSGSKLFDINGSVMAGGLASRSNAETDCKSRSTNGDSVPGPLLF